MLSLKNDLKHPQHSQESLSKRARVLIMDASQALPTTTMTTVNTSSSLITPWPTTHMKAYENSPGK